MKSYVSLKETPTRPCVPVYWLCIRKTELAIVMSESKAKLIFPLYTGGFRCMQWITQELYSCCCNARTRPRGKIDGSFVCRFIMACEPKTCVLSLQLEHAFKEVLLGFDDLELLQLYRARHHWGKDKYGGKDDKDGWNYKWWNMIEQQSPLWSNQLV